MQPVAQAPAPEMRHGVVEVPQHAAGAIDRDHVAAGAIAGQAELAAESLHGLRVVPADRVDDLEHLLAPHALVPDQRQAAHPTPRQLVEQLGPRGHQLGGERTALLAIERRSPLHDRVAVGREPLGQRREGERFDGGPRRGVGQRQPQASTSTGASSARDPEGTGPGTRRIDRRPAAGEVLQGHLRVLDQHQPRLRVVSREERVRPRAGSRPSPHADS